MHTNEWVRVQTGVLSYKQNKPNVDISRNILAQLWKTKHDKYFASTGFAKSVDALANAVRLHKRPTILRSAVNAVDALQLGLSVGCPEIRKNVTHMLQMSGLTPPHTPIKTPKWESEDKVDALAQELCKTCTTSAVDTQENAVEHATSVEKKP